LLVVKAASFLGASRLEQFEHGAAAMHERQHAITEQREVVLEFADAADPVLNCTTLSIPARARCNAERRRAPIEELETPL
jgi:hypothetical protein